jgi:protein SCO1
MRRSGFALLATLPLLLTACGGNGGPTAAPTTSAAATDGSVSAAPDPAFKGLRLNPEQAAPQFQLRDVNGEAVEIAPSPGRPTYVIWVYVHCPDVCPLIVQQLRRAQDLVPEVNRPRIIAVSVDPKGDTPASVRTFEKNLKMTGRMQYLVGTRAQLEATWKRWGIAVRVPKTDPELVEHASPVYGISGSGKLSTIYQVTVTAADLAHDAPLLGAR